jgi:hypothetical protein
MYSGPNVAQPGSGAAKTALPVIGAILCGGLLLFLLAATVVLALIPIYISTKTLTPSASTKSKALSLYINAGGASSGRRRDTADGSQLSTYVGGSVDSSGSSQIKTKLFNLCSSNDNVQDIDTPVCTVVSVTGRKRRLSLKKRQSSTVLLCITAITYKTKCRSTTCQAKVGPILENLLVAGVTSTAFDFTNIGILKTDGSTWVTITRLIFSGFFRRPSIKPGGGSDNPTTLSTGAPTVTSNVG